MIMAGAERFALGNEQLRRCNEAVRHPQQICKAGCLHAGSKDLSNVPWDYARLCETDDNGRATSFVEVWLR